jgi:hypothetical protein
MSTRLVVMIQEICAADPNIGATVRVDYADTDSQVYACNIYNEANTIDVFQEGGYQQKLLARAVAASLVSESFVNNGVPNPLPSTTPTLVCGQVIPDPTVLSGIWPLS